MTIRIGPTTQVEDVFEDIDQRRLGPLEIVHEKRDRAIRGKSLEETSDGPGDLLARGRVVGEPNDRGEPTPNEVTVIDVGNCRQRVLPMLRFVVRRR